MRLRRSLALLVSTGFAVSGLAVVAAVAPTQAAPLTPMPTCGPSVPKPCVVSFTRNGSTSTGDFSLAAYSIADGDEREVSLDLDKAGGDNGGADLGAAARSDVFSVTIDMGSWVPRIAVGKARDVEVTRTRTGGGYQVTVTGRPILLSGQCDQSVWPWRCPEADVVVDDPAYFNNVQWDGLWSVDISDAGYIDGVARRNSMYGLNYFHNFAASAIPPSVQFGEGPDDPSRIVIDIANRRYLDDLSTLVIGRAELRIPDSFLSVGYGITDPASMTGKGVSVSGPGSAATTSVTHDDTGGALDIVIDNVTFPDIMVADGELRAAARSSAKRLKIERGIVTPTKGKVSFTDRSSPAKGVVGAKKSKARGAKITGYQASCKAGKVTVTGKSKTRRIVLTGLAAGRAYECKVRALSKAGPGGYSKPVRLAARP
jgi:hypothetical protein